jgi:hypothetical protein
MSSAGTNGTDGSDGTDISTTLTTQSDLLYRDGSGLQRLPKGTASQELRMNSGATAPEWYTPATASSDFVKIAEINGTGSSATMSFNSVFTSTYDTYKIIFTYRQANKVKFNWRYRNAGGEVNGTSYYYARQTAYAHSTAQSVDATVGWGETAIGTNEFAQASTTRPATQTLLIYKPSETTNNKLFDLKHIGYNDDKYIISNAAGEYASVGAMTGVQVSTDNGDNLSTTCNAVLYGVKG